MPTISIITVCFNAEKYIEQTIKSVINQKGCDIEYIVIDGASTDKTLDIIKQYNSSITQWISESDEGIADAMNKGIALATGDYLLFLHADDYLINESVIAKALSHMDTNADIYAFDVLFKTKHAETRKQTRPFGLRTYFKTPIMHQGAFCGKNLFDMLGGFDNSFKITMDYDFFYRAKQLNASMNIINKPLSVMRDTGISSRQDWQSLKQRFMEEKRVHLKYANSNLKKFFYMVYWMLYSPYRKIIFAVNSFDAHKRYYFGND